MVGDISNLLERSHRSRDYTLVTGSSSEDDDDVTFGVPRTRPKRKCFTHCGVILIGLLFLLSLVYIPLFRNIQTRIVSIPGWNYNTSRDTTDYVFPHLNTSLIEPNTLDMENGVFLLIVVCSAANNFYARQTIRETWGNSSEFNYPYFPRMHWNFRGKYLKANVTRWRDFYRENVTPQSSQDAADNATGAVPSVRVKVIFLLGQTPSNETQSQIGAESEQFGDVLQEGFLDSYNNLTLKSVMLLKWVSNNCLDRVRFVMKCDDDVFLNVPNLLHILMGGIVPVYNDTLSFYDLSSLVATRKRTAVVEPQRLLMGFLFCHAKPIADVTSKWYSPIYMYSGSTYPNYLSGTGYVMSTDALTLLYNASLKTPLFHLEDVFLTGICAHRVGLKPRHSPLFTYTVVKNLCAIRGMITQHPLSPDDIRRAYDFVTNGTVRCAPPDVHFNSKKVLGRSKFCK
ncbi:beta-1,3-galactosyltransferase 1-like [Phlebotomus argentipes]|uniref:beta-1,3-galactosyltransferase 1-like n=1 Tax=Phlebotomus argentipes TaxID=94469 RepID=UPI0028933388|nr:beta-1,3-galactosyltransferase 1-like [Phlebotomus argentipes]